MPLNPRVEHAAGLDSPTTAGGTDQVFARNLVSTTNPQHNHVKDPPIVTPQEEDDEVQRRTGFPTQKHLLTYIFILCNGDIDIIIDCPTVLTWYEKWFAHFEYKWGRTKTRMRDLSKTYGPHREHLQNMIANKYSIERRARNSWPRYVSMEEDEAL